MVSIGWRSASSIMSPGSRPPSSRGLSALIESIWTPLPRPSCQPLYATLMMQEAITVRATARASRRLVTLLLIR